MPVDFITHFRIERSYDGQNWHLLVDPVPGGGAAREYSDTTIPNPTIFYRLFGYTNNGIQIFYNTVSINKPTNQPFLWAWRMGGTLTSHVAGVLGVTSDSSGNVIVCGNFQGTIDFAAQFTSGVPSPSLVGNVVTAQGNGDIFVAKYSASGAFQWVRAFGGTGRDAANGVTTDSFGNIYVTGVYTGSINFGVGLMPNEGSTAIFLLKLSPTGVLTWVRGFGNSAPDAGLSVTVDGSDNPVICGTYAAILGGSVDFNAAGPGFEAPGAPAIITSSGDRDSFVAKYAPTGAFTWVRGFGSAGGVDDALSIGADKANDGLMVAGHFSGTVNFGNGITLTASGSDIYVVRLGALGNTEYVKQFNATIDEAVGGIGVAINGDWAICGSFRGTINFGCGPMVYHGARDMYAAKFNRAGTCLWSQAGGSNIGTDMIMKAMSIDVSGNALLAGATGSAFSLGGIWTFPSGGTKDLFMVKFGPTGQVIWINRPVDGIGHNELQSAVFDNSGNMLAGGFFPDSVDFGTGQMNAAPGGSNGVVCKYGP